jgi:predicted peptidase
LEFLLKNVEEGKPALFLPGRLARLAHRSAIDNTLQPYSVFIPLDYDEKTPTPLFVTLHGSGVDERKTIFNVTMALQRARARRRLENFILLSPKARGLSDWYLGDSGKDVIECLDHVKKLYSIDERNIILDGFSMGGYGAWRLGLLYPNLFKAIIIRSGAVSAPMYLMGENILDLLDKAKTNRINIFIVHGDKDNSVPVENARLAVKKLEELGIEFHYTEVKGAAHGGYDKWDEIFSWLKKIIEK